MWEQLIKDPLAFGSRYSITAVSGDIPKSKKVGEHGGGETSVTLHDQESTPYYATRCELDGNRAIFTVEADGDERPCYYLRWGGHQAYRIRLESKTVPRVFFTAPLDGCSVVVEGNVMLPNVYHANACKRLEEESPLGDPGCTEKAALYVLTERNKAMFGACEAFPANWNAWYLQHEKEFPDLIKSAGAVTPLEYGVLIDRPSAGKELKAALTQPVVAKQLARSKKFARSSGTVFGVLDDQEHWHFYMQRVVDLANGDCAVLRCTEFWPTGFNRPLSVPYAANV